MWQPGEQFLRFRLPGLGVVFDIDGLGGGYYGYRAWQLFMREVDPTRLRECFLVEGDTLATLYGQANEFCIGIYGLRLDSRYVRRSFEALGHPAMAPPAHRFLEKADLDAQPLPVRGWIDQLGQLVTGQWTAQDHDLCVAAGWGYAPRDGGG